MKSASHRKRSAGPAPFLLVLAGLPGTGKSTLARALSERTGAAWMRVDTIEAAILKAGIPQSFETGLAAYLCLQDLAADQLRLGHSVIVDAVNGVEPAREMWRTLGGKMRADLRFVEVLCSDPAEHRRRVESRSAATPPLPPPTWAEVVSREFVRWNERVLTVDTVDPLEVSCRRILDYLAERRVLSGTDHRHL